MAAFPWDVAITAGSTVLAGFGAALFAGRHTRSSQLRQWQLERQQNAAEQVLLAWSDLYLAINQAKNANRRARGPDGRWSSVVDTGAWNSALERLALVAEPVLVESARELDGEMWRLIARVGELGDLAGVTWLDDARPAKDARRRFLNTARQVLGAGQPIITPQGKPPEDDPMWDHEYWNSERERLQQLQRERSAGS